MTAATLALTDFLLARIAEDEAVARAVEPLGPVYDHYGDSAVSSSAWLAVGEGAEEVIGNLIVHVAEPSRVLAECEAKRRIVAAHEHEIDDRGRIADDCAMNYYVGGNEFEENGWCATVRALAAVYADHPDYRDEWRPWVATTC